LYSRYKKLDYIVGDEFENMEYKSTNVETSLSNSTKVVKSVSSITLVLILYTQVMEKKTCYKMLMKRKCNENEIIIHFEINIFPLVQ